MLTDVRPSQTSKISNGQMTIIPLEFKAAAWTPWGLNFSKTPVTFLFLFPFNAYIQLG